MPQSRVEIPKDVWVQVLTGVATGAFTLRATQDVNILKEYARENIVGFKVTYDTAMPDVDVDAFDYYELNTYNKEFSLPVSIGLINPENIYVMSTHDSFVTI